MKNITDLVDNIPLLRKMKADLHAEEDLLEDLGDLEGSVGRRGAEFGFGR